MKLRVCIMPVLMLGGLMGIETNWHTHYKNPMGEVIEMQSCLSGPGLYGTLAPSPGLYGIGAQWGFQTPSWGGFKIGVTPQVGISHDDYGYRELPMGTQFGVGLFTHGSFGPYVLGIKYWHLSNGGLNHTDRRPNKGLDIIAIMGGYTFE